MRVDAPDRCPRFTVRRIGVTMGESPAWLARRLALAGMRPISNVVDVTNYVLLERGQPLHAFDLDRLPGRGLVVRLAGDGERMTTLDGVERALTAEDLLVCDAEGRPQAIAGIMGGQRGRGARTAPPRSCSRPRTSSRWASRARRSGSGCAPSRAPASSAGSTRTACSPDRHARPSCSARSRRRTWRPSRSTSTRCRSPRRASRCACPGSRRCSASSSAPSGSRTRCARSRSRSRSSGVGAGRGVRGDRADVPAGPRARDRHRRGGRAPHRVQRDPAHAAAHDRRRPAVSRCASASGG